MFMFRLDKQCLFTTFVFGQRDGRSERKLKKPQRFSKKHGFRRIYDKMIISGIYISAS